MGRGCSRGVARFLVLALMVGLLGLAAPAMAVAQVPGPELFAQEPRTPMEIWSAIDYLVETGQAKKAAPYLERFAKAQVSDDALVEIRGRFGAGSILRLADDPATSKFAEPLSNRFANASRRHATQPDRLARLVAELSGTPREQDYAVAGLREAGPYAVPALVEALGRPGLSADNRAFLVRGMSRLDRSSVPALLAVLVSGDPVLAADAAAAIGRIGDPSAVPFLTYPASAIESPPLVREAAQAAIGRLTGHPFNVQSHAPAQVLTDAAWRFHRHQVEFPGDPVAVWAWDKNRKMPVPQVKKKSEAESDLGLRLADQASRLEPQYLDAQAAKLSLTLQRAIDLAGYEGFAAKHPEALAEAVKAGPLVSTEVLRRAVDDGKDDLAAAAATALARVTDPAVLSRDGRPHPLVEALSSPGSRVQFEAARALVNMAPGRPFPGSSRVVPTLTRFVTSQSPPRAVVIDHNSNRGSQITGSLRTLGYEPTMETRGDQGFRAAAETADVELVLVSYALDRGATWGLIDVLTNLKNDARTANLPVYVYGPLNLELNRRNLLESFPRARFMVQPVTAEILEQLLGGRPSRFSDAERSRFAGEAASLLARIAAQPASPFAADLTAAEPALALALSQPATSAAASSALADIPNPDAQRSLADVALDPSRPAELRRESAAHLAHNIERFGPLMSATQEDRLSREAASEADPPLRAALESALTALRAKAAGKGKTAEPGRIPGIPLTTPPAAAGAGPPAPAPASGTTPLSTPDPRAPER